jgi:hypothetical protein
MPDSHPPTERDRFWLDHEAALAASDQTAKAYAAGQGLSLLALYQARKRLRPPPRKAPAGMAVRVAWSRGGGPGSARAGTGSQD